MQINVKIKMKHDIYRRINPMRYKLSVLICSLPNRLDTCYDLLIELNKQSRNLPVQIIYLGDNKSISVGEKRNQLLSLAKGEYITFIDDDDTIHQDYIKSILEATESGKKVISFNWKKYDNGVELLPHTFRKTERGYRTEINGKKWKIMPCNHLCVWKNENLESFPLINLSEDWKWAEKMRKHYSENDIHHIDKFLYIYQYDKAKSETR